MEESTTLAISESAMQKMHSIETDKGGKDSSWRLALVKSHCMGGRGYAYRIAFENPSPGDSKLAQIGSIDVYAPSSDLSRISGSELDYVESLQQEGFVVKNPNARSKCPCGHHDIFD